MRSLLSVLVSTVLAAAAWVPGTQAGAAVGDEIISQTAAERHGLSRPWLAQVELDHSRAVSAT